MTDLSKLQPGLKGSAELLVGVEHTAPRVGSGRVPVLATPVMINLIEAAALAAAEHLLPAGHQSLGIHLDVRHFAATPVGMRVYATAELVGIDGRTLSFRSRPATSASRSATAGTSVSSSMSRALTSGCRESSAIGRRGEVSVCRRHPHRRERTVRADEALGRPLREIVAL
jgi:fluoroacetyl-CoA thioesterase